MIASYAVCSEIGLSRCILARGWYCSALVNKYGEQSGCLVPLALATLLTTMPIMIYICTAGIRLFRPSEVPIFSLSRVTLIGKMEVRFRIHAVGTNTSLFFQK